jgi:tetratricopeptide (TPR) repeat protein
VSISPADRSARVDSIFDAAVDLPQIAQPAFVAGACGGDLALRDEVMELLLVYNSDGVLDAPAARIASSVLEAATALGGPVPERIGPFRVMHEIGRGGMGRVFLGERVDGQFEQRVAIKLIQQAAPGVLRRFIEERRLLARLAHPGISRLFDGGITPSGLPYFVMELVEGEPIDRYCESRQLPLDRRLELVARVCEAVTYAHQHLIIHRDLKPSNILVTPEGQVKLLDFGIAKLLDADPGGDDAPRTEMQAMTPEFAAPEQILGRPISTGTDVYSLGVLLYVLLTGERPYDVRGRTPAELERIVCEHMPPKPSSKAPASLQRRIRGDLDLIVMTALQKDVERRYQSPAALAQDLQRFLDGHAIAARADSAQYRVAKFVGRHRVGVAIASFLALGLAGAASRERVLRHRAEVEARKAWEVERFLVRVFDMADPSGWKEPDGGRVSARELLDRGAARIDSTLSGQPEVQAELRSVLGRVYTGLGLYEKAASLLERSLAQRTALHGPVDTSVVATMDLLGTTLTKLDKLDDAELLLRRALDQRRRLLGDRHAATATTAENLATLLEERTKLDEAEPLYREVLATRQAIFGDSSVEVSDALNNLGLLRFRKGAYAEAESLHQRGLDIKLARLGEGHAATARSMQNLAMTLQMRGRYEDALSYHRRALAAKRKALGDAHPSVTISMNNLANLLANQLGRLDEADSLVRQALALDRQMFGDKHSFVAASLQNVGIVGRLKGDFADAEKALNQALRIHRALSGERDVKVAYDLAAIALVRLYSGDGAGAIALLRQSHALYRELLGDSHLTTIVTSGSLAYALTDNGAAAEAESLARAALQQLDAGKPEHRTAHINVRITLGKALLALNRTGEALPMLERVAEDARRQFGEDNWRAGDAMLAYGKALAASGRVADAGLVLRAARVVLERNRRAQPRLAAQAVVAAAKLAAAR